MKSLLLLKILFIILNLLAFVNYLFASHYRKLWRTNLHKLDDILTDTINALEDNNLSIEQTGHNFRVVINKQVKGQSDKVVEE